MPTRGASTNAEVKARLCELYDDVFAHDGYGRIEVDVRILRRGQKEVILRCGKEYRFVVDFAAADAAPQRGADFSKSKGVVAGEHQVM